jgi:hypothetical protein
VTAPSVPVRICGSSKSSFGGATVQLSAKAPCAPPSPSTAMTYSSPAVTRKLTRLSDQNALSSFAATGVSEASDEPRYTASSVSNVVSRKLSRGSTSNVSKTASPSAGAVQRYQTEWPPASPAWLGSPACFVALVVRPRTKFFTVAIRCAAEKASLAGGSGLNVQLRRMSPTAPRAASTAIR